jgi:hypothetical protein
VPKNGEKALNHRDAGRQYVEAIRAAYIEIVNDVVDKRPGVPTYLTGTYREAKVRLTPTKHLGPAIIAAERKGISTPAGTRNAHIIFVDRMRAHVERAEVLMLENGMRALTKVQFSLSSKLMKAARHWQSIADRSAIRQCQAALADELERMVRSRAETVLRAGEAGAEVQREAKAWLTRVDAIAPDEKVRAHEAADVLRLEREAEQAWASLTVIAKEVLKPLRYVPPPGPRIEERKPIAAEFLAVSHQRVDAWLRKNAHDRTSLAFVDGGFMLSRNVRKRSTACSACWKKTRSSKSCW